jgi:hypothetical protein
MFILCSYMCMTESLLSSEHTLSATFIASRQANGWTIERQRAFLETLAQCGYVNRAATFVGMTRQSAYDFKNSTAGRAFSLAWDAALLLARQGMIDDAFELAFEGSVERIYRDGKLVQEKRKRDPKMLLATIERLGSKDALGSAPVKAVAAEFSSFLDAIEAEATGSRAATAEFMGCRAEWSGMAQQRQLNDSSFLLRRAALDAAEATPRLAHQP